MEANGGTGGKRRENEKVGYQVEEGGGKVAGDVAAGERPQAALHM